jgi:glycosyltransferase involved in cell wall biosynthesis
MALRLAAEGVAHPGLAVSATGPLRVCIDARLDHGRPGGVQQEIMGLASGLSRLGGEEEYLFLAYEDAAAWLGSHLGGACRILPVRRPRPPRQHTGPRAALRRFDRRRRWFFRELLGKRMPPARIPDSDGTVERAGVEVMHFAMQGGFRTTLPTIYAPQDLQHLHLPELFHRDEHAWREGFYRPLCEQARAVTALARWGKEDLVRAFGLPPEKVWVIGLASILSEYPLPSPAALAEVQARLALPEAFAFFPAQTFAHKNHLGLVRALAELRDRRGLTVPLVLSGHRNAYWATIEREIRRLRMGGQVRALGFVTPLELRCLYQLARMVVFPSRFEGFGMPVVEAFHAGVPVASSSATCLPDIAGDAALLFDPEDVPAMADAVARIWTDPGLREELVRRGRRRALGFTWDRMARSYRALYRLVGGRILDDDDRRLLAECA